MGESSQTTMETDILMVGLQALGSWTSFHLMLLGCLFHLQTGSWQVGSRRSGVGGILLLPSPGELPW